MTTSTAGMSFNSPPATERAGFDNEEEYANYYMVDCEPHHPVFGCNPQQSSYINIQNFESGNDPSSSQQAENEYADSKG